MPWAGVDGALAFWSPPPPVSGVFAPPVSPEGAALSSAATCESPLSLFDVCSPAPAAVPAAGALGVAPTLGSAGPIDPPTERLPISRSDTNAVVADWPRRKLPTIAV